MSGEWYKIHDPSNRHTEFTESETEKVLQLHEKFGGKHTYYEAAPVKDSGQRREFETGARRDIQEGKGRYDLIPPHALQRLAVHMEKGAVKYGDRNWELGMPQHDFWNSGFRHLLNYRAGMRDEDHLAAALFNIMALMDQERRRDTLPDELFDLPEEQ